MKSSERHLVFELSEPLTREQATWLKEQTGTLFDRYHVNDERDVVRDALWEEAHGNRAAAALAGGARPGRRASASTRSGSALGHGRSDRRREVGHHAHLGEHGADHGVAVERLDLPVAQVPEVGARHVDLRSRRLDDAGRGLKRPEEGALNRQLDGDRVAKHVDAVQLTMDIGEEQGDAEDQLAEVLAPIALLADSARFSASVPQVDHAVIGEAADEPGDVQDAALRRVVGMPDDGLLSRWAL